MFNPIWIVAFTGHRPGPGPGRSQKELAACRERIKSVLTDLSAKARTHGGSIELLTGVAAGADIEAAEVASELSIPVHVILPVPSEQFAHDFDGELAAYWSRAGQLIESAKSGSNHGTSGLHLATTNPRDAIMIPTCK